MSPWRLLRIAWRTARVARSGTEREWRFDLAEKLTAYVYPKYKFSDIGRIFLDDQAFIALYRRYHGDDHAYDRLYCLRELLKLVAHIPGDTAECGVFEGASSEVILQASTSLTRTHHLFPIRFQGLSAPGPQDGAHWTGGDLSASESTVRRNLQPYQRVMFHSGWIPQRFEEVSGRSFAFVHIDVDLHDPTRDSIAFFYPRLSAGGLMVFDDYGFHSCPGARKAIDDYLFGRPEKIVMLPTGQALIQRLGPTSAKEDRQGAGDAHDGAP